MAATIWTASAVVAVAAFFGGYALPGYVDPPSEPTQFLDWGQYALLYLGSPVATWLGPPPWIGLVTVCGAIGLFATVAILLISLRARLDRNAPALPTSWLAGVGLSTWAVGSAFMTGWGRLSLGGPEQALTSRYTSVASLLWVGLAFCLLEMTYPARETSREPARRGPAIAPYAERWAAQRSAKRIAAVGAVGAFFVLSLWAREGIRHLHGQWQHREPVREAFREGSVEAHDWEALGIERELAESYLSTMRRLRLSLYRDLSDPPTPVDAVTEED